ncbi:hypothetical protein [Pseudarthrobacter sp. GA104]|uniref:hypothetical protein n=1 Tax=Pseudarthrobacter sp. GA104 TaxID=2676311 RepID=UPI0012F8DFA1|nr:hypothetical protein [Pseudarthrobacter sp. GA104]MUU73461.1 hypothetical protein [Pseudarthrobacter sp. GA104]
MQVQLDVGSWGLFCGYDGRQLVLVDDKPCGPVSARKPTRAIPRRLLLDENRIAQAMRTGSALSETVSHAGEQWAVELRPVLSPRTATVLGVLAGVAKASDPLPEPPLVGVWEWEIERDSEGQPTLRRRTYWDRNLFHIYDVDPSVAQQRTGYWEAGEWASELIDQSDQMRVSSLIRDGIQDGLMGVTGKVRCLTYNIVTGYGSTSQGRRHLRLVGVIPPIEPNDDKIFLQGFSYDAPETFHDMAFEQDANAGRVDDVLRGVMALAKEPMAVIDAATLDVLMTSPSWRREDFGHVGGLGEFAIDDAGELHAFIAAAATDTVRAQSMKFALRRVDGSVQNVSITATGVRSGVEGRDAVVRLDF